MKFVLTLLIGVCAVHASLAGEAPLTLESTISLGEVNGRIDHLTVDLQRQRLYVAELGNDSVGIVDLKSGVLLQTLTGLRAPQGVLFVPITDELYVANEADGSVRVFKGSDLSAVGRISLRNDADNLHLDPLGRYVVAGYGNGGLALIDIETHREFSDIPLQTHPEGFQLSQDGRHAFVNVPDKRQIAVVDLTSRQPTVYWPTTGLESNFPMALEASGTGIWVAFRSPARLVRFDTAQGAPTATLETCTDSDDVFVDELRHRVYVICGGGQLEVWQQKGSQYERLASIATAPGARTGLFVPEFDRLYVAARAQVGRPAAILVFRPQPN